MKKILGVLLLLYPLSSGAEIYKCLDSQKKMVYQDKPCTTKTVGKVAPAAPVTKEDELRAQRNLDRLLEENRYYDQKRREEARLRQEELRRQEALEQRQQEIAATAERESSVMYIPVYGPGYPYGRHRHRDGYPPAAPALPRRPCVIGYVGDKGCR